MEPVSQLAGLSGRILESYLVKGWDEMCSYITLKYLGESNDLPYFNVPNNCEMPCSPHTRWISLSGLKHSLEIHAFRFTWLCLIVEVLATQANFLQASGYCSMVNRDFTFRTTNIFGCFCGVMAQFKLVKFPN